MPSAPPQILRRQLHFGQLAEPLCPRLRKFVQQLVQCLALAVALVPLPIERSKDSLLAGFQNHSRPRNPVLILCVDQVRNNFAHTPRILALFASPSTSPVIRAAARREPPACAQAAQLCFPDTVPSEFPVSLFSSTRSFASRFSVPSVHCAPCLKSNNGLRTSLPGRCRWTVGIGLRPSRCRECQSHDGESSAWTYLGLGRDALGLSHLT